MKILLFIFFSRVEMKNKVKRKWKKKKAIIIMHHKFYLIFLADIPDSIEWKSNWISKKKRKFVLSLKFFELCANKLLTPTKIDEMRITKKVYWMNFISNPKIQENYWSCSVPRSFWCLWSTSKSGTSTVCIGHLCKLLGERKKIGRNAFKFMNICLFTKLIWFSVVERYLFISYHWHW